MTAAVLLVPGVAWADEGASPTDPVGSVVDPVTGLLNQGATPASGTGGSEATGTNSSSSTDAATETTASTASGDQPALPSLPPQLQAALEQLGVSSACSDAIQKDLTKTLSDIPGSVQAIIDELTKQLGGQPPDPQEVLAQLAEQLGITLPTGDDATTASASAEPTTGDSGTGVPVLDDLQALVTDLLTTCMPAPPTGTTPPPPPPSGNPPQPPVQAAAPPVAQPVSYPGYAPTGSIATDAATSHHGDVPLAALAGVLVLVSGAAVTVTRLRTRAAREDA